MKSISLIKPFLFENRFFIFIGMSCLVVVDILQLLIPRVMKWVVDDLTALGIEPPVLLNYAVYIVCLGLMIGIFRYFWRRCLLGVSRRVEEGLRNRLFSHLQTLSPSYFDHARTGELMAHATNDITHVRMATGMGMVALTDAVILGASAVGFMAYINLYLTGLVLLPMPLIVFGTRIFSKKMHRRYEKVQAGFADLTEVVRERFAGIRIVKAFGRQKDSEARLEEKSNAYVGESLGLVRVTGAFFPMMVFFSQLSLAIVLFWGGRQTILQNLTPGDFVAFISYLGLITWPMMALGWVTNLIQRGGASLDRINRILKIRPEICDSENAISLDDPGGDIRFESVYFAYDRNGEKMSSKETSAKEPPGEARTDKNESDKAESGAVPPPAETENDSWVLSGVDFFLRRGETLGIVGPPGGGKSSVLALIPRLYDPGRGRVLIHGHDVRDIKLAELRASISIVPQEPFLFAGTIRENILFENDENMEEEILVSAAKAAAVYETIVGFSNGFETIVGEKGVILSGGQKQRIALARAFLLDRPILLLDDPVSQVDMETGARIVSAIGEMSRDKTTIIVSHRLSALAFADRIMVLDNGRIAAMGTHEELMRTNDYYARTFGLQEIEEAFHEV